MPTETGAAPARRRSSREALIAAALVEFSEKGYEAATVTDVAERAGVTTGALYAHFRGKLELLLEALGITPVSTLYRELAEVASQQDPPVAQLLSETMAAAPDEASLLLLDAVVAGRRDPAVAEVLRAGFAAYERRLTRATELGTDLGVIDPSVGPEDLLRVLSLLGLGRLVAEAVGAPAPSSSAYERLAELLLRPSGASTGEPAPAALARVRSRSAALERARQELAEQVVAAIDDGHSLRQVGAAAGVSHERVRQILRERER